MLIFAIQIEVDALQIFPLHTTFCYPMRLRLVTILFGRLLPECNKDGHTYGKGMDQPGILALKCFVSVDGSKRILPQ